MDESNSQTAEDVLLPPSAKKTSKDQSAKVQDDLLPQQSKSATGSPLLPSSNKSDAAEDMLPPVAMKTDPEQVDAASADAAESIGDQGIAESEKVLLPDGDGGFTEVSERKTTVQYRGAKIELDSMKRDEKDASRSLKNFIVITFCFILLIVLMVVMGIYFGPESQS